MTEPADSGQAVLADRAAQLLSHALSPSGMAGVVCASTWVYGGPGGSQVLLTLALLAVLPAVVLLLLASGPHPGPHAGDLYDPPPVLRQRFLMAGTLCYLAGYAILSGIGSDPVLRWVAATFTAGAGSVWLIDRRWKISIHNTGAGGGAVLLASVLDPILWSVCVALPLLAGWARWRRGAHTSMQLLAGAGLGAVLAMLLRTLFL